MTLKRATLLAAVCALGAAARAQEPVDREMIARIRGEGLDRSQAQELFSTLADRIGPRLTGSPAYKAAAEWARERLAAWGLKDPRLEPWEFGRGWTLEGLTLEMIEPRYLPLIGYAEAWSPSTRGEIVGPPLLLGGKPLDEIERLRDRMAGAIVMTQPLQTSLLREDRPQPTDSPAPTRTVDIAPFTRTPPGEAQRLAQVLREAHAGVVLRPSRGPHGTVFVLGRDAGPGAVPSLVLAAEHYNLVARLAEAGLPVKLRIKLETRYYEADRNAWNVLAELPGSDPALKDEVVMLGAHLDSWHAATGATDNADGSAVALEALRILAAVGARPRRTIRVALWGGEEQGLLGSKAYVAQHLAGDVNRAARERLSVYFNIDPGTGPIYGFYLEGNEAVGPIFDAWLEPFRDLGARRNVPQAIGSTDHVSFIAAGVPGFNPVQSYEDYDVRTHHTNMDTAERTKPEHLKQAAVVMASFLYHAASREQRLPRGAVAKPAAAPAR